MTISTTQFTVQTTDWTDLGAGPLLVDTIGVQPAWYAIADAKPAATDTGIVPDHFPCALADKLSRLGPRDRCTKRHFDHRSRAVQSGFIQRRWRGCHGCRRRARDGGDDDRCGIHRIRLGDARRSPQLTVEDSGSQAMVAKLTANSVTGGTAKIIASQALPSLTQLSGVLTLLSGVITGVNTVLSALTGFNVFGGSVPVGTKLHVWAAKVSS